MKNKNIDLTIPEFAPDNILELDLVSNGDETFMSSGDYLNQSITATYTIEVTKGGLWGEAEITIFCQWGIDHAMKEVFTPEDGVPFPIGTVGITGVLNDGGDGLLELGDKWEVKGTGSINILTIEFCIEQKAQSNETLITYYYPTHILMPNNCGTTVGVILLNETEALEFNKNPDLEYYAFVEVPPRAEFSDNWSTLPLSKYIAIKWITTETEPSKDLRIQMLGYIQSKQEVKNINE